jgi:hypothetical protein
MDWKSTQREIGICQMKKMKYVKSRGRFWNRDILESALLLLLVGVECECSDQKEVDHEMCELMDPRFRGSGGVKRSSSSSINRLVN